MKSVSAEYTAYRALSSTSDAHCLKITRVDGDVFGFTDHDKPLVVDAVTYVPGLRPFAIKSAGNLEPANSETEGGFGSAGVTAADIRAGLWDYAAYQFFRVNWSDLTMGVEKGPSGRLGQITRGRTQFVTELLGIGQHLNQTIGRLVGPECDAELGDARCKVRLNPPAWAALTAYTVRPAGDAGLGSVVKPTTYNGRHFKCTTAGTSGASEPSWNTTIGGTTADGTVTWTAIQALTIISTVTSVIDRLSFYDSARAEAADFFSGGKVTFTGGANDGIAHEVKSYPGGSPNGLILLQLPFPYDIQAGDAYEMTAGCRFRFTEDCKAKFDNGDNFRGFPHVPGLDFLMGGKQGE